MEHINNKTLCENCKFYCKHYYWYKDKLKDAYSGHCIAYRARRLVSHNGNCKKWELAEERQQTQCEQIQDILKRAAKQINHITLLLNAEKGE